MLLIEVFAAAIAITTAIFWRQMTEQTFRVNPWIVAGNDVSLQPLMSWCIGPRAQCVYSPGAANVWVPILINDTWLIDQAGTSLRISVNGTPMLFVTAAGGVVVSPTDVPAAATVVVAMTPVADTPTPMWASHGRVVLGNTTLDAVCHTSNASMCGSLFRSTATDPGIFWSPQNIIVGAVPYGFIAANLRAKLIVNASIVITHYTDRGDAVPCQNNLRMPTSPTTTACPTTTTTTTV